MAATTEPVTLGNAGLAIPKGAEPIDRTDGHETIIGFAAAPGSVAFDGEAGKTSPYVSALLKHLAANKGFEFGDVMTMVAQEVYLETDGRQTPWINTNLRRLLYFGAEPDQETGDGALISRERRKLLLTIAQTPDEIRKTVESIAKSDNVPLDTLYGMLKVLEVDTSAGAEQLETQLRAGAENLRAILDQRDLRQKQDAELFRLAGLAERAEREGAIALALDFRARASARADQIDNSLDRDEADIEARRVELAATYAEHAETAILNFDYATAAAKYAKAFEQVEEQDRAAALIFKISEADALRDYGDYKGDNGALRQAIQIYEAALSVATRKRTPEAWAKIQNKLGSALWRLGKRERGPEFLVRAIKAYEAALEVYKREQVPLDWAMIQHNMGNALHDLGERESSTKTLTRAAKAYEAALTERRRDRVPLLWASTQNSLGNALLTLAERERSSKNLERAVKAYEAALTEFTRTRAPMDWAMAQVNLGNALGNLAERGSETETLTRAVQAYEAALTVFTRERVPLLWASTQDGLGNVLSMIGKREGSREYFARAIKAYEAALEEKTRDRMPLDWAATQSNLANALQVLGERSRDTETLKRAIMIYLDVLDEHKRDLVPLDWAATHVGLGRTFAVLGVLTNNKKMILFGRRSLQDARDVFKSAGNDRYDREIATVLAQIDAHLARLK
jgi:uncharacterized caspase-like protein